MRDRTKRHVRVCHPATLLVPNRRIMIRMQGLEPRGRSNHGRAGAIVCS